MKILATRHIREADVYTIQNEPISSLDLMERAAVQLFHALVAKFPDRVPLLVFAGPGNNGGDGIALARMLAEHGYPVDIFLLDLGGDCSPDMRANLLRLPEFAWIRLFRIQKVSDFPQALPNHGIVIDSLFGSGLTRPLQGLAANLVDFLNELPNYRVAIDIPSGLPADGDPVPTGDSVFKAHLTLSLEVPKIAFFLPGNEGFVGDWRVLPIGLDPDFLSSCPAFAQEIDQQTIQGWIPSRTRFQHKGIFGHALLIAGSKEKMGAAVLASWSCLRAGAGLLTCRIPASGRVILQTAVPEAMVSLDSDREEVSSLPQITAYQAIGAGPGLGTGEKPTQMLLQLLNEYAGPLVLDADALNILAENPNWLQKLPAGTILTPHPGEFKRLFGDFPNQLERLKALQQIANRHQLIVVLKGAHTAIVLPNQEIWLNSTGNPGMATGGSGDVLTGIVLSLLAQGYSPEKASILAVFLHGRAGDLAKKIHGEAALLAHDIIECLGSAFVEII